MSKPPCIAIPFKQTSEVDWARPLRRYIATQYEEDPNAYNDDCQLLHRLRQDMRGASADNTGRDIIYRYYTHLESLENRFPVSEQGVKVQFKWTDAFTGDTTSQHSLAFEKASVVFNLATSIGMHAASLFSDPTTDNDSESLILACTYFQVAAERYHYINENFLHPPSLDLQQESVESLESLMLAQAQECVIEKACFDNKKDATLSKLAQQAATIYGSLTDKLKPITTTHQLPRGWLLLTETKMRYYQAYAQFHEARANHSKQRYGIGIARLGLADQHVREAGKLALQFNEGFFSTTDLLEDITPSSIQTFSELIGTLAEKITEELSQANKDNDMVYHDSVPNSATLPPIEGANVVSNLKIETIYSPEDQRKVVGGELFAHLIPMAVHESSSLYSEEKSKLLRTEEEKVNLADGELEAALSFIQMPGCLRKFKLYLNGLGSGPRRQSGGPNPVISEFSEPSASIKSAVREIQTLEQSGPNLAELRVRLDSQRTHVNNEVEEIIRWLDEEQRLSDRILNENTGNPTFDTFAPSSVAASSYRAQMRERRRLLDEASPTDTAILDKYRIVVTPWIATLQNGVEGVTSVIIEKLKDINIADSPRQSDSGALNGGENLVDIDEDQPVGLAGHVQTVQDTYDQLLKIKKERHMTLDDLKTDVHNDDISGLLIKTGSGKDLSYVFTREMEKFHPLTQRLQSTVTRQQQLIRRISDEFRSLMESPQALKIQSKWDAADQRKSNIESQCTEAVVAYHHVREGIARGLRFYTDFSDQLDSVRQKIMTFVDSRARTREQLAKKSLQDRATREQEAIKKRLSEYVAPSQQQQPHPQQPQPQQQMTQQQMTQQRPYPVQQQYQGSQPVTSPPMMQQAYARQSHQQPIDTYNPQSSNVNQTYDMGQLMNQTAQMTLGNTSNTGAGQAPHGSMSLPQKPATTQYYPPVSPSAPQFQATAPPQPPQMEQTQQQRFGSPNAGRYDNQVISQQPFMSNPVSTPYNNNIGSMTSASTDPYSATVQHSRVMEQKAAVSPTGSGYKHGYGGYMGPQALGQSLAAPNAQVTTAPLANHSAALPNTGEGYIYSNNNYTPATMSGGPGVNSAQPTGSNAYGGYPNTGYSNGMQGLVPPATSFSPSQANAAYAPPPGQPPQQPQNTLLYSHPQTQPAVSYAPPPSQGSSYAPGVQASSSYAPPPYPPPSRMHQVTSSLPNSFNSSIDNPQPQSKPIQQRYQQQQPQPLLPQSHQGGVPGMEQQIGGGGNAPQYVSQPQQQPMQQQPHNLQMYQGYQQPPQQQQQQHNNTYSSSSALPGMQSMVPGPQQYQPQYLTTQQQQPPIQQTGYQQYNSAAQPPPNPPPPQQVYGGQVPGMGAASDPNTLAQQRDYRQAYAQQKQQPQQQQGHPGYGMANNSASLMD